MRYLRWTLIILGIIGGAIGAVREVIRLAKPQQEVTLTNPPSQTTLVVVESALAPVAPPPQPVPVPAPAPLPVRDAGFNGRFQSNRGLQYQFEQTGPEVKLYLLNTDGQRRYVGYAYDEGTVLRFGPESFYSPVYEKWGAFPPLRARGDALVSVNDDGTETVFFRRVS